MDNCCSCPGGECGELVSAFGFAHFGALNPFRSDIIGTWRCRCADNVMTETPNGSAEIVAHYGIYRLTDGGGPGAVWPETRYTKVTITMSASILEGDLTMHSYTAERVLEYDWDCGYLKSETEWRKRDGVTCYEYSYTRADDGTETETETGSKTTCPVGDESGGWVAYWPCSGGYIFEHELTITASGKSHYYEWVPAEGFLNTATWTVTLSEAKTDAEAMAEARTYCDAISVTPGSMVTDCETPSGTQDVVVRAGDRFRRSYLWWPKRLVTVLLGRDGEFGEVADGYARSVIHNGEGLSGLYGNGWWCERSYVTKGWPAMDCEGADYLVHTEAVPANHPALGDVHCEPQTDPPRTAVILTPDDLYYPTGYVWFDPGGSCP